MTRGVWHSWTEDEQRIVKELRSLPELIRKRNACQSLLDDILPSTTSKIREIPISGKGENTAEHRVHGILDIRARMMADLRKQDEEISRIIHLLDPLKPDEQAVLNLMYFQNKRIFQIARIMNFSERSVYRLRVSALKTLCKSWQSMANT